MSDLLVNVVRIDAIEPHPNADKLEIVKLGGWQIVSGKGNYIVGDLAELGVGEGPCAATQ